jgi:hypothetical protein
LELGRNPWFVGLIFWRLRLSFESLGDSMRMRIFTLTNLTGIVSLALSALAFYLAAAMWNLSVSLRPLFPITDSDKFQVGIIGIFGFLFLFVGCCLLFRRISTNKSPEPN